VGQLHGLVSRLYERAGMRPRDAELMARLLVRMDLRGVFSHGTRQTPGYIPMMQQARVNPRPQIRVVAETRTTRVLDGDGGMGHLPCYAGARWAVDTAREYGTAAVTTRNHFHFGGASKYALLALEQDCIGIVVSSHRYDLSPEAMVREVNGGSPVSVALPGGDEPPLVLDMGAGLLPWDESLFQQMPFSYFKDLGISAVNRALGGVLPGIYLPQFCPPQSSWESNQGAFIAVFSVECFMPVDQFKSQMDAFVGAARKMQPFPGSERAELPGGFEHDRERTGIEQGIPLSPEHEQALESLAGELGVETPFSRYQHTRFDNCHLED
jgi:LDH2 family malate/lactate/ureidoglycolate dehydrogenase